LTKVGRFNLYLNDSASPIIYSGQKTQNVEGRVDFLEKFQGIDKSTILVESTQSELNGIGKEPCKIEVLERNSTFVKVQLNCTTDEIVVLNEYFDGNWRAYLNETKINVYKSNINQNGVFVSRGVHNLEFRYQPRDFLLGYLTSALSSLLILSLFVIKKISGKRPFSEAPLKKRYLRRVFLFISPRNRS